MTKSTGNKIVATASKAATKVASRSAKTTKSVNGKCKSKAKHDEKPSEFPPTVVKEDIIAKSEEPVARPPPVAVEVGAVWVDFNHYHKRFPIHRSSDPANDCVWINGAIVNDAYAFSFVHKGNFQLEFFDESDAVMPAVPDELLRSHRILMPPSDDVAATTITPMDVIVPGTWCAMGVKDGATYRVAVRQDPQEVERQEREAEERRARRQLSGGGTVGVKTTTTSGLITQQLKGMTLQQLEEKGQEYKDLIEARELEDCLYSR